MVRLKRLRGCHENVYGTLRSILHPAHISNLLGGQRFLRFRFIHLAIRLDMQVIFHLRIQFTYLAGGTVTFRICMIFRSVGSTNRNPGIIFHHHSVGILNCLCARQDELVHLRRTYRALHNQQVGIRGRNIRLKLLHAARQRPGAHQEAKHIIYRLFQFHHI